MQELTCPKCRGQMHQYERNGVVIDQCADCRGIFLDRGELERLAEAESRWAERTYAEPPRRQDRDSGGYRDPGSSSGGRYERPRKGKKQWIEELFG
jgi:Zn-finger nucleic acid-binding protein